MSTQAKDRRLHPQFLDGDYYARKSAEHAATLTHQQNTERRQNARRSNVADTIAILPGHEVAEDFFRIN